MLSESQATNRRGSAGLDPTRSNGAIGAIGVIALLGSGASPKSALSWKRQAIPTSISSITLSSKIQTACFFPRIVLSSTVLHIHEIHEMSLSHDRINAVYSRMFQETHCLNKIRKIQISPSGLASKHPVAGTRCPARMCCLRWTFAGGVDIDFDYIFWLGCHHLSTLQYIAHHNHIKQKQAISKMPRQKRFKSANLQSFKRFKHFKTRLEVQKKPPL